ncbi:GGDEF domain-containing protein [Agaribacterium haliotis]|uniref:GGDEF domain-containing protein n=1 Tax=Agaribacterium haliotis TaxID=2013869 RepID=UPI000BB59FA4|nr:GGDEF domain-containing protein [Agaribacterium haliotis]
MSRDQRTLCPNGPDSCPNYSELEALHAEIAELKLAVRTDPLTKLFNRRHLNYCLDQELERTTRTGQATTLLMLDIDFFKNINDQYGHDVGDKALVHIAQLIRQCTRKLDVACRYGGEEFAIVLPASNLGVGVRVAERLRQHIEQQQLSIDSVAQLDITASIGVASADRQQSLNPEQLIKKADEQLYKAKGAGRNQISCPDESGPTSEVSAAEKAALFD